MKLAKLSLAAITVASLSASAFAADSLAGMFKNGKASGQLKAYYYSKDNGTQSDGLFTTGAVLNFNTAVFNGFSGALTFQGNSSPFATSGAKSLYNSTEYGTGAQISQAYLQYANSGFFAKAGRQYVSTPLVAGSGSRMTKESFEGYVLGYTGLPQTVIAAGYVDKYQHRTDKDGNIGSFKDDLTGLGNDDGAWTIFAINKSIPGLKLTGAYAEVNKGNDKTLGAVDIWYGDVNYHVPMNGFTLRTGVNYYDTQADNTNATTGVDTNTYSLMLGANMNGLDAQIAYGENDDKTDGTPYMYGLGNGTGLLYNNTVDSLYVNDQSAGMSNLGIKVGYDLSKVGVAGTKVGIGYNDFSGAKDTTIKDYTVIGGYASYKFSGSLKGLSALAQYEGKDSDDDSKDGYRFRFKAIYSF